jgi:hypothetical protein
MPLPVGTYTINANGTKGTLVIGSTSTGSVNGTVFGQPISGFFDETEQEFHFLRVTSSELATFQVYQGTLFSFSPTASTNIFTLAGEFLSFPATGPAAPSTWLAQLSQKLKEKDGKDGGKDKEHAKEVKDAKDHVKELAKEGHKELEHPQGVPLSDLHSLVALLSTRLDALEQQIAVGRSFIGASERPAVGTKAAADHPKKA